MSEIENTLVNLYDNFLRVGSIVASTTELSGSGRKIITLRAPNYGSIKGDSISINRHEFFEIYEIDDRGCFNLFQMKVEYQKKAQKYKRCIAIMNEDS
jgi:hypothetical protein